jgi:uncharacterized repeat protein (TIGR03847 family)
MEKFMPEIDFDLNPVTHITTGAIGPAGKRVFYLQGQKEDQTVTLIVEKAQIQSLAVGLEQFLLDLRKRLPDLDDTSSPTENPEMELQQPLDPLFRVGQIGLGYDDDSDLLVLVAREIQPDDKPEDEASVVRFWCTRSQLLQMCQWGLGVAESGRPICGNCGQPIDLEGHFCPKRNGHQH